MENESLCLLDAVDGFDVVYSENNENFIKFNIMPDRLVEEHLIVKEYRIKKRYGEAIFDRTYKSSMRDSPSHLIFLTALLHTQKLIYALLCHELGLKYDPYQNEVLKIWPTLVNTKIPKLIRKQKNLKQKLIINKIKKIDENKLNIQVVSDIEGLMQFEIEAVIYIL